MKTFAIDDFCSFRFLSSLKYSPRGKNLAFVVTDADKDGNTYHSNIWYKKGRSFKQLTSGGKERGFTWLDDDSFIFAGNREENKEPCVKTIYYKMSVSGGEAQKFIEFPLEVSSVVPLRNGDFILTGTTHPGFEELYKGDKKYTDSYLKYMKENEDYEELETVPWWWNGSTFTKGAYDSLFRYSKKTGKLARLTELNFSASEPKLSPDGKYIYFFGNENKKITPDFRRNIYKLDLADNSITEVMHAEENFFAEGMYLADSFILLTCSDYSYGMNTDLDFYKMSYEDNSIELYTAYKNGIGSSVGSDIRYGGGYSVKCSGDTVYFIGTENDSAYLFKIEDGVITKLTEKEGSADSFDVCGDKIALIGLYDLKGQEIYDDKLNRLSSFNEKAVKNRYVAEPEKFTFMQGDHEVHGFVLKPYGFEEGKKFPCVLDIHGGPKTVYGPVFYHEMQLWAGMGYFVIYCNPTGSDGRGTFSDIRGKYGTVDFDDIMAFTDECLIRYPEIDKNNLFETGGSYGGFMTNWIIGHTDRFRACASQRSISNWFSFYGVSDIGVGFSADQNACDPWSDPEKLWSHSPMKYADKAVTPTLFIHSFEDYRCPIDQGYQMYTALMDHGVDTKMVLFRGENHELSRSGKPKHRIKRLSEITNWFEKYKG
ncbi:MAG: S9 family peptidase [Clostridia bacterium]|nr:S9 family peptidase [Clostridia bacterium]